MLVVDASVAIKILVREPHSDAARMILTQPDPLVAPDWVLAEIGNAIWKKVERNEIGDRIARQAIAAAPSFFERLHPTIELLTASYELMFRLQHALYDCFYLALAIRENAAMITADQKFHRASVASGFADRVRSLADA